MVYSNRLSVSIPARASAWRSAARSSRPSAATSRSAPSQAKPPHSLSPSRSTRRGRPAEVRSPPRGRRPRVAFQAVEQELHDFSYIVSHDLAASFRHASEFSRLLLGDLDHDLTARQHAYAEHIQRANANCQAMIEQLLVYSRAQQKPLKLALEGATPTMQFALLKLVSAMEASCAEVSIEPLG